MWGRIGRERTPVEDVGRGDSPRWLLARAGPSNIFSVGATEEVVHEARVITATHRDLRSDVHEGRFRSDLHARISEDVVDVPRLRQRREDILLLLRRELVSPSLPPLEFALASALLMHPWPLNVRELKGIATQLQTLGAGNRELTLDLVEASLARTVNLPPELGEQTVGDLRQTILEPPSRSRLEALLREHRGVVADIALRVGRTRKQVHRWAREHGLSVEGFRDG